MAKSSWKACPAYRGIHAWLPGTDTLWYMVGILPSRVHAPTSSPVKVHAAVMLPAVEAGQIEAPPACCDLRRRAQRQGVVDEARGQISQGRRGGAERTTMAPFPPNRRSCSSCSRGLRFEVPASTTSPFVAIAASSSRRSIIMPPARPQSSETKAPPSSTAYRCPPAVNRAAASSARGTRDRRFASSPATRCNGSVEVLPRRPRVRPVQAVSLVLLLEPLEAGAATDVLPLAPEVILDGQEEDRDTLQYSRRRRNAGSETPRRRGSRGGTVRDPSPRSRKDPSGTPPG